MKDICDAVLKAFEPFMGCVRSFDDFLVALPAYEKDDVVDATLELVRAKFIAFDEEKGLLTLTDKGVAYRDKE